MARFNAVAVARAGEPLAEINRFAERADGGELSFVGVLDGWRDDRGYTPRFYQRARARPHDIE